MEWLSIILMGLGGVFLYVGIKSDNTNAILNSKLSDKDKAELMKGNGFLETLGGFLLVLGFFIMVYVLFN